MGVRLAHATTDEDPSEQDRTPSTLVRGRLPAEAFALPDTFAAIPDLRAECAPVAAAGEAASMSLLWAQTADDDLTATVAQDPTVSAVEKLCQTGNRHFYRIEWSYDIHWCRKMLLQSEGLLLRSQATDAEWTVTLLYPDRETLRQAHECCERYDLPLTIERIRSFTPEQQPPCGLTPDQYMALTQACQHGYFKVPRELGLKDLAATMNISHQALSERLRRGHNTLINATLLGTHPTSPTVPPAPSPF